MHIHRNHLIVSLISFNSQLLTTLHPTWGTADSVFTSLSQGITSTGK